MSNIISSERAEARPLVAASDLSDEAILADARKTRTNTIKAIALNGSARLVLSPDFLNIDYLIDKEKIFFGLKGEFDALSGVSDAGSLFIDSKGRKFILINPYATIEDRQFFLAAQFAHFRLHVTESIINSRPEDAGLYFPKVMINQTCLRQASIFAFGLLVPDSLQDNIISELKTPTPARSPSQIFGEAVQKTLMPPMLLERHIHKLMSRMPHNMPSP
jgi:IrrE N-terminal-like domain